MAKIKVEIDTSRLEAVARTIEDLGGNLETPIRRGLIVFQDSIDRNFEEEGRPKKWKPSQRVIEFGGQTLSDSGDLRGSIQIQRVEKTFGEVGTNIGYGRYHQEGTSRMVARPFAVALPDAIEEVEEVFKDYLFEVISRADNA